MINTVLGEVLDNKKRLVTKSEMECYIYRLRQRLRKQRSNYLLASNSV